MECTVSGVVIGVITHIKVIILVHNGAGDCST